MQIELIHTHPDFQPLGGIAGIAVDLRYQGTDNFVNRNVYGTWDCAWLHREAAAGLVKAVQWLADHNHPVRLLILDALRPHRVQMLLWEQLKGTGLQTYLASPERGSIHSYGMALDVTLQDQHGHELDMGSGFDEMTPLSHPELEPLHLQHGLLTETQLTNRHLLRNAMLHGGFAGIRTEWWHFDFGHTEQIRRFFERID